MTNQLQKGDIVIRAYAHHPEEWGIIIDLEIVNVDPRENLCTYDDFPVEYVYVTVLWPGGYTTQEIDYELWTPKEAFEYAERTLKELA